MAKQVSQITIPIKYLTNTKALGKAQSSFSKFGRAVAGIGAASVAAIGAIGTAAVRMSADFETSFAKIQGLVGVSKESIGQLEEAARTLGPQFGKSANEAADALFFITSAGLRGAAATEVLEASLKGAAIGLGETKTIADLATSAVNAYGEANLSGTQAVDTLTEAVRLGKLEPAELAQSMGQVLPIASNLGVSFQEVGAAFAGMSKTGTDAAKASTQLRGILNTLAKPTVGADKALAEMGTSAAELRQQIRDEGLFATLEGLTTAFDGNIEATTEVFGNVRALSGVLDLMGAQVDDNRELFNKMTDDLGVLDEAFEITSETVAFKFDKAMETAKASLLPVGDVLLDIGSKLLDSLMPAIEGLAPLLEETFAHLEQPLVDLAGVLPSVMTAIAPLLPLIGQIAAIFVDLVNAALPVFNALLNAIVPILEALIPPLAVFIEELMAMLGPSLVTIIEQLTPLIEQLLPIFLTLWEALSPVVLLFIETFLPLIESILPLFVTIIELAVLPMLQMFAEFVGQTLPMALGVLQDMGLLPTLEATQTFAQGMGDVITALQTFLTTRINAIIGGFEQLANSVINVVNSLIQAGKELPGRAGALFENVRELKPVTFTRVEVPGKFDRMTFPEVDVAGIGGNVGGFQRGQLASIQRRQEALAGVQSLIAGDSGFFDAGFRSRGLPAASGFRSLGIPEFANGGIVTSPTIGLVGEAGPEAVIPLDRARAGTVINVTVNAGMGTNGAQVGEQIVRAIKKYERHSGPVFVSA